MLPNKQCMRDVLRFISENNQVKVDSGCFYDVDISSLNLSSILHKKLHIISFSATTTILSLPKSTIKGKA